MPNRKFRRWRNRNVDTENQGIMRILERVVESQKIMQQDIADLKRREDERDEAAAKRWERTCAILRNFVAPVAVGIAIAYVGYWLGTVGSAI